MNIVLVVMDSLRKDCVNVYGQKPPWGKVHTPHFDAFAAESLVMNNAFPESLPTLPTRRALYTGQRVYPFDKDDFHLKGDFVGAPGWGPIREDRPTLAEMLKEAGYRTGLISDVYHMFKPSKNFWRGFDQWKFLRGQERDPQRSGPRLTQEQIDYWLPRKLQTPKKVEFIQQCIMNIHDRPHEQDYFSPRVFSEAATWLQENFDAEKFFLTVESFDPHEPWIVPEYYRKMYLSDDGQEQIASGYSGTASLGKRLLRRTQANYSGSVTQCDRWFGYFVEQMRVMGLLDNTMVIVTSDHGHSIGDYDYMGKRGYPSRPEVFDIPLMIRFPRAASAGKTSDMFVQHTDISASILSSAGVKPAQKLHGNAFFAAAKAGRDGKRDHVTVGWGSAVTVINRRWWFNAKADGTGVLLYDRKSRRPFARNVAGKHKAVARKLFEAALADAGGSFPDWIVELARNQADAPGCSDLAAR
ncbi:MAG: sulfatase [Planctomycetes bacterium]|nr:sulfatase [Planctomycetota bacterium]